MKTDPEKADAREIAESSAAGAEPGEARSRPPEEVSYFVPWMIFLMILAIWVAWYFPVRALVGRWLWRPVDPGERSAASFVALAYRGVSDKPGEIPAARFKDHLQALTRAGYKPISLQDVRGLYRDGRPLPDKAVLLTFEHGRRTSYFETRQIIRRMGWNAVMGLWVKAIEEQDPASLRWPYVRNMVRSENWEVMLQSYDGFRKIPTGPSGRLGNALTTPAWDPSRMEHESLLDFQERLRKDHERASALVEKRTGIRPFAFVYPFGDFGQYHTEALMIPAVNMSLVERYYEIAFLTGNLAFNSRYSDPRRLNRLLVPAEWTGADLVAHLDRARPGGLRYASETETPSWIVDWGETDRSAEGELRLRAGPDTTGAKVWLAGSDLSRDFHARIAFRLEVGQMGIYLRASSGGDAYVYLGVEASGSEEEQSGGFWLRQKEAGGERYTLDTLAYPLTAGRNYVMDLFLRDRLFYAQMDGATLFSRSLPWGSGQQPGMLGISVWSPERGRASAQILDVSLRSLRERLATWPGASVFDRAAVEWIHANAHQLTAIGPRWRRIPTIGPETRDPMDFTLYKALARIHRLKLIPTFVMEDEKGLNRAAPSLVAEQVSNLGADGLFLDLSEMSFPSISRLAGWIQQCGETLAARGLTLFLQAPRTLEQRVGLHSLIAVAPNGRMVVASESEADALPERVAPVVRQDVPLPPADELPVFYMVPGLPGSDIEETSLGKSLRLFQNGMAAFQDEEYVRAIRFWKEWLDLEPDNPRALMLIGDAEVRLNNMDSALAYYAKSLDLDPGQVSLALRRARLLDDLGRSEEALHLLNLYARLFPEQESVQMAQAQWLTHKGQFGEAVKVIRRLIQRNPENMDALALLLRAEDDHERRLDAMRKIMQLGGRPEAWNDYAALLARHDLMTLPDARPLIQQVVDLAGESSESRSGAVFKSFIPRVSKVSDTFLTGDLSNAWQVEGGESVGTPGRVRVRASPRHTEVNVRLLGSVHVYNGFVECVVESTTGNFWLFARRSADHLVRFGISGDRLYLQAWRHGRVVSSEFMPWSRPAGPVRLALEVSGRGAMGHLNGQPVFSTPIHVPASIGRGWVGVSMHDPERGVASAELRALMAGPLSPRIALLRRTESEPGMDEVIAAVRPLMLGIQALCPEGYVMDANGNVETPPREADDLWRLFSQYHRVWILPAIRVPAGAVPDPLLLREKAADLRVDGFLLLLEEDLGEAALTSLKKQLAASDVKLVAAQIAADGQTADIFGLGSGLDLFGGIESPMSVPVRVRPETFPIMPGLREAALMRF